MAAGRTGGEAAVREQDGLRDHGGSRGVRDGHLDDRDLVVRRLAVLQERLRTVGADVDVDVLAALGRHEGVRVRAAVGLDRLDVLRRRRVADVEDPDALPVVGGICLGAAVSVAVRAAGARVDGLARAAVVGAGGVHRQEQQVAVHGDVVLRTQADHLRRLDGLGPVLDVVDGEAVVVAGERLVAGEGQVAAVGALRGERAVLGDVREQLHVAAAGLRAGRQDRVVGGRGRSDGDAQTDAGEQRGRCSERAPARGTCAVCGT